MPTTCESCDQRGILEIVECSGGAVGDVYFCQNCLYKHRQECSDCKEIRQARSTNDWKGK